MHSFKKMSVAALVAAATFVTVPAGLAAADDGHGEHAVFVQTVEATGNRVLAYSRADDGSLTPTGSYATGGNGVGATGAVVDPLASQDGLTYDESHQLLLAVNSGSDSISVFSVDGDQLDLRQTLPSGGSFPVSVAVHDNVVEVLNGGGSGTVASFRIKGDKLAPVAGSVRSLGLNNVNPPFFLSSPGQVGFSKDGRFVIVTTKLGNSIQTFKVSDTGRLAATATVTPSKGVVPFAFELDKAGHVLVVEAGTGTVTTYNLNRNGSLSVLSSIAGGQRAACWIRGANGHFYVANAGSANLTGYNASPSGQLSFIGADGVVATTGAGPVDIAASPDGDFLYVQEGGAHAVEAFSVQADGTLVSIGSWSGLAPMEGIVAI